MLLTCPAGRSHRKYSKETMWMTNVLRCQTPDLRLLFMPINRPLSLHFWPSLNPFSTQGPEEYFKNVTRSHYSPAYSHLMNFHYDLKWIQTLYIHPSRPSRICLRSPLQPNLWPPHSYLCLQGTDHSFRASDPALPLPLQTHSLCPRLFHPASSCDWLLLILQISV